MATHSKLTHQLSDAANQIKKSSEKENQDLWNAYQTVGDIIYTLVQFGEREPANVPDSCSSRISLTANMVQSFYVLEEIISSGAYWTAAAVLRQHMETLSRIIEHRSGKKNKIDKKPPNVKNLPCNMEQNYGRLSELCHTSGGEVLGDFAECEESEGVATILPRFRSEWANNFFSLHIAHMLSLAVEIWYLQNELHPNEEIPNIDKSINGVSELLVKTGFWKKITDKS